MRGEGWRRSDDGDLKVAVVGSGLAGLAATWLVGRHARVTVYEAHATPGMGAHSVRLTGHGDAPVVDVPLRVFTPAYYPTLLSLYQQAGIVVDSVDYAASFSRLDGDTYFVYRNAQIAGRSLPWIPPTALFDAPARVITRNLLRLHRRGVADLREGRLAGLTLGSYLAAEGYDPVFVEGFILPAYASVCTCSTETVRDYPADIIVGYFCSGVTTSGVMRAVGGSLDVIHRLLAPAREVRTGTSVGQVRREADGVLVTDHFGEAERYDHVILATPADRAAGLIAGDDGLRDVLAQVPHESSRVVVHRDVRLAPRHRASWRPVNFLVADEHPAPMATIWLNEVQPGLAGEPPLFQTWNPVVEPEPGSVITEARVSRPVVTLATRDLPARLEVLQSEGGRRIWPVGSYAGEGIPLLEAAAVSAIRTAQALRARTRPHSVDRR